MNIDNRRDILLLLLFSPGKYDRVNEPIVGRTRLVKMLFLFMEEALNEFRRGTEILDESFYSFFPWKYGPFSVEVYEDLKFFELRDFITKNISDEETIPESAAEWSLWLSSANIEYREVQYTEYEEEEFKLTEKGCAFVQNNLLPELSGFQRKLLRDFRSRLEAVPLRAILKYVYEKYPDQTLKSNIHGEVTR